ncbi:cardiac-enriched FHL2-interacting protein [Chanodichthys erythropterus]|uniref:cardiac-enriched FHL2-interacting protein n=1 Tax=Chanodichthys erythropterus TaxID=933992 RepID=UPI00351E7A81
MSSLEKRHTGQRGSMQGHHKYSDGFSDTSSSGSFMDDTDREVSNLTDRAFRSLCIGEEAIYNDSEFSSSPTERHKAFAEETQQKTISQETFSYNVQQYGEAEAQSEMASTFQHSYTDVTHQEQAFREGGLSYMNNGSKEVTWQQNRSSSRVSSLIKAFSSGESYHDSGTCDVILARDRYRDFGSESWDRSALLSIQRELSEFSGYHQNFKSGPFQSYRNHFYTSDVAAAVAQMDTTVLMKSSIRKFKALNSTNCFFHSEFSPFQLWEEYNRFPFGSTNVSGFMSASEFPRWYDSPMYKELKDNNRIPNSPCESRHFNQRQIQDVVAPQRSRSTVIQKALAIEKRCESEMASNYPPWKKNNNFVRNKLPGNRPSTVSPTNEKTCRPDSNLFSNNKVTHEVVVESTLPSSVTPFNITQLLTPVIHTRQETETSEILQFAHTPSVSDYSSQGETDPKLQTDVKHLHDSYKSKASSLLFNLKDNRKRVKSTYSPTRFKGLEITDRNKQTSKLEGRESRFSDILVSQETAQENLTGTDAQASCNLIREPSAAPITPKDYTDRFGSYDNLTLTSPQIQDGVANYKSFCGSSEGHSHSTDRLANAELSTHSLSAQNKSSLTSEGQLKDLNGTFSPARPEIANVFPKAYPPTHSMLAQTSERYGQSDNMSQNELKQRKDFGRKTFIEYSQKEAVKERCPWDHIGSVKETNGRSESRPFRGEIAALIEMDKQRKATAKQYSADDSYSVRKETYMQKVNEDIKLGRLAKEEEKEVREHTISPRKTSYSDKSVHDKQLNTFSKPAESYGIPRNSLQNKTSPLKEDYCGLQSFNVKNDLFKDVQEQTASSNSMTKQNTFDQRAQAHLQDHKSQKNEGLYSYQPYKYERNKQWHMASTSEDKHNKESIWTQKQSEMTEQTAARSYKMSNTSSSSLHINHNEFSTNNGVTNPGLQNKDSDVPIDNSAQNNITKQEDRFSINDILTIRDNEQARRLKDNTFVFAKSEHSQNQIKYDRLDKPTISEPVKEQEQQGYKVQDVTSPSPGYIRKDFHNINETNISTDRKDRIMSKDTDKVTTRVFSYKERGQSKQEILTSKLKAHAQKEISAIKEKGLAKQGILARNATKTNVTTNNDGQEGHSVKKEITADKLNHLFQDITYSSVTQYKEQIKTHDHPKNGSPPSMEKQPLHFEDNQKAVTDKKGENVKYKALALERQNDKHPADDKEMKKETFTLDRGAIVADIKNNVQKNYQPSRISEDKQISMSSSSEDINTNKESAKQSHEMSPSELMSGHLTAAVKTENSTSQNPPALHIEKQTIQYDQKENLYGRQCTYSEKAMTKPADQTKKDLQVTSTETTKTDSSLNKNSLLGLDGNTLGVEEPNVHHKSKITATVEQSKNEPIKNSSEITASQLTSSSSDMKFKNGIPPAKRLMEPAKSELTSNLQTNTLSADAEKLINRAYKHNPGDSSDSEASSVENVIRINSVPTNNPASQRTQEPETPKPFNNEDGQALIIKNNTTKKNDLAKQQNNTLQVKALETTSANQMVESQSKPETNKQSLTQIASDKEKESCQQKELHQDDENTRTLPSFDKNELPRSHQSTSRIKNSSEAVNNSQHREKRAESASPKQKEQGFPIPLELSHEKNNHKSTKESQEVNPSNSEPKAAKDKLEPNVFSQQKVIVDEGATQKNNTEPISTQNVETTTDISNITNLTPSKEEPVEEPMIYSICVSRKTEEASDDEPMIYSICVSSKCHIDEQQNPVKQDESSVETERCVKDESFSIKNDKAENEHDDVHRQTEMSSNTEEKEDKIEKCEPPATTDKSSVIGRVSTSYEDLLVKYGLPARDHAHLTSNHMQDERERKEMEETETHLSYKPIKNGINETQASKEKSLDNTQTHPDDMRQAPIQQASVKSQPLKENESKIKQVQHYDIPCSNNMAKEQQSTENDTPKLAHSTKDATLIPKDKENVEQLDRETHNIDPSRYSRRNDIQSKEKKVEEQVRNTEETQSLRMIGNIIDDVFNSRKSPKKTENVSLTAQQPAIMSESTRETKAEVVKAPISNASMAKDTVNKKLAESTVPGWTMPKNKPQMEESEDKMFNHTNTFMPQKEINGRETFNLKVQKTTHEKKKEDSIIAMKQESVSNKDAQTLQKNGKGDLGEKKAQEKLQVEFNMGNEITNRMKMVSKDGAATDVNNYKDKVSSIGEDVCTVVKQDQASSEVPKNHLESIKVSAEEVSSNKEFMAGHKNQHEVIKRENLKGTKGAVVTDHVCEKDFTEQKKLPVKTLTAQNEPKTVDKMKGTSETSPKHTHDVVKEIIPPKKNGPSESEKTKINPRQGAVHKQEIDVYDNKQPTLNSDKRKKEDPVLSLSGQNDGDLEVNENRSSLRGKKERNVETTETKQAEWTNTNQYQPGRSFVPETKGSASYEQENSQLSQQNTSKEGILSKSEATQKNKKGTRPEISAIADYARLKVISAEDDTKDLDIFPKLDYYNSYDQSVLRIHQDSHVNVSDTGGESKREIISSEKGKDLKRTPSQLKKQTDKETLSQKHNHLNPSMSTAQPKPVSLASSGSQDGAASMGTQPRALINHKELNTKPALMEHPNRGERNKLYQPKNPQGANTVPLQAENTISRSRQLTHDKTTEKGNISHSGRQESLANVPSSSTVQLADNQINMASPGEEMEELQYYTVNALDTELKPKETSEPPPPSLRMSQNKDSVKKSEEEKKEDSLFLQSLTDYGKVQATGPRSNSSSPAMGKPIMFKVKDNTMRTSSVTKTVKPRFHRSFSDEFRIGSPKEHLSGSEKEDEIHPKQSANPPVLHEPAIAVHQPHKVKEMLHNNLSSAEYTTKQSKSFQRRSQLFDEEETHSVTSTMSEDMANCAASFTDVADISLAFMPKNETYRNTYQRPASACYERPESACYERPESACSDMRPMGKPPTVPPKSEKALRRAQRLATRRMKKAETPKVPPENQDQLESESNRDLTGMPSSPSEILSTHLAVQATPPLSQYDIQPNYTQPTHSIVAQPLPMTQRKLLQDPNSGQYFMVDVPLTIKTKTFYDPETGKYVQLNVRQRSQGALTQPASVEMLNTPYMLYRGFLPMAASSLPPLRSSSEMSTPAALTDEQDMTEAGSELWRQNVYPQNAENSINTNQRHTDIITMSELEDFAMEST